jgi:hypothetical protein
MIHQHRVAIFLGRGFFQSGIVFRAFWAISGRVLGMTLTKRERLERDLADLRREEGRFARVPGLTLEMRLALDAVELCGGRAFCERSFVLFGGGGYRVKSRVLKRLIREGLIEVMGLGPAVYRVTKLGRIARSLR